MSTRILPKFKYFEPKSLSEALSLLARYGEKAKVLAGGTDLLVLMKDLKIKPEYVINIAGITNLSYIVHDEENLRVGPLTTIRDIEKSVLIREKYTAVFEAARSLGTVQVRNMATIGGNLCRASPSADMVPPLLVLDAETKITALNNERVVPLEKFFVGPGQTVLGPNEILTEIRVPCLPQNTGTAFLKIGRVAEDLAKVNVAVSLRIKDICEDIKISLGAVAPTPIRARKAEEVIKGKKLGNEVIEEAANVVAGEIKPITDIRSIAEYRKEVSKVLVKRAIRKALERAVGR